VRWWTELGVADLARQVPPAELPRAHFVNLHEGCPHCGTAVFRFGGFYPWRRCHRPCDYRSRCPSCDRTFPSNDLAAGDFTSGAFADDGFGYFDAEGRIFLFAATYCWEQQHAFVTGLQALTRRLRRGGPDEDVARRLGLMLLRYAAEEIYLAAAPQFRYGESKALEEAWEWGQPDWASEPSPETALVRKGSLDYSEATPHVAQVLAVAYDTVWPLLRVDQALVDQAQSLGLPVSRPNDVVSLIEEMLSILLQCILDRGAGANKPSESLGALMLLRALDRPDAQDVLEWLFDDGPDQLRVFTTNDFLPDGMPPEATGDYNGIHTDGLFALEHHLRALRTHHPASYPESRFPSLTDDPRSSRVARVPHEVTMIGRSWFQLGDGDGPGSNAIGIRSEWFETSEDRDSLSIAASRDPTPRSLVLDEPYHHTLLDPRTLLWAVDFTRDETVRHIWKAATRGQHRAIGTTILDGAGIAILRTGEAPERAAIGVVYGDPPWHRHLDLLDVQLFAFGRPFLVDLGYPRTWATRYHWEAHWATHNLVWGVVPDLRNGAFVAGRGRLLRTLVTETVQLLDLEAERWAWDDEHRRWYRSGVRFRRLVGLVETDGDGVILLDFARVHGGTEHWRICRGLEGSFATSDVALARRPGTVADPAGARGQTDRLSHADYAALAYLDDVQGSEAAPSWRGSWQSRIEPAVHLDLHQVRVSAGSEILTARATSVTGTPEESDYRYQAVLWRRTPASDEESTCVDLVFEPRVNEPTLSQARSIPVLSGSATVIGVELVTRAGERRTVYWAPESDPDDVTTFADGTAVRGPLAVVEGDRIAGVGVSAVSRHGQTWHFPNARQDGQIVALDRAACTVDVRGLHGIRLGDRVRVNPLDGGHNYAVEHVELLPCGAARLRLDMSSVLGRAPVRAIEDGVITLGAYVITRTGFLHGMRLVVDGTAAWTPVLEAANRDGNSTTVKASPEPVPGLVPGAWVSIVDYVVGDTVRFEPLSRD
jgi:hypothetical protein